VLSSLSVFGDVRCPVDIVLGTARITLRECLALEERHVLRLDQGAGDDLWVVARGVALARAEVSITENVTSVRITECVAEDAEGPFA
jgi:flagellar motor switch protein FliN/FliY